VKLSRGLEGGKSPITHLFARVIKTPGCVGPCSLALCARLMHNWTYLLLNSMQKIFLAGMANMKTLLRIGSTALFTAGLCLPAMAEQTAETEAGITASIASSTSEEIKAPPIEPATFELAIAALVRDELGEAGDGEDREAVVHQSIRAFYAGSSAAPIWVSESGPGQKARDLAKEIDRAATFGLDPEAYALQKFDSSDTSRKQLAKYELAMTRAALDYAHHAKAGRIYPGKVGHSINDPISLKDPRGFLEGLRSSNDVAARLRDLHPKHPQFIALTKKLGELCGGGDETPRVQIPDGPALRAGIKHEQVVLLRKRLKVDEGDANSFDDAVKAAVIAFQKQKGLKADGVVGNGTRRLLNGDSNEKQIVRILINMERWRWLPDDMGGEAGIYVWANIPEFRVRVVKGGKVAFTERVIVGKTNKQTPVFSDMMEWIEIHPTWYVPNSIKVADIKPSLRRITSKVMERYHLRLDCGKYGRDWKKIDWNKVDIRGCSVSQPPGKRSVLGDFKFKFPNKHIVYMHDTPQKGLFKSARRTYSHGCVRIQNPRRMAEILLEHDKGMTSSRLGEILKGPKRLHKEDLNKHVPVHMTYFTAIFDDEGVFSTRPDVYGHDRRLAQALTGKGHLLPAVAIASRRKHTPRPTRTAQDTPWNNAFSAN
jgi:murein L,D-transpeptidase YcbB/YkuD